MKIVIIGAGLIGVTSAYILRLRGHEVMVIDRRDGPGQETSFANGALLTPSMSDPWNAPGCWRVLLASLGRSDAALQLRFGALPSLLGWGVRFLRNSREDLYTRNTLTNLRLGLLSLKVMESLRQCAHLEREGGGRRGVLKVFRTSNALGHALDMTSRLSSDGLVFRELSTQQTIEMEPALAPIARQLAGAIHYRDDQTEDAYRFCAALSQKAGERGVEFSFNTSVSRLEARSGQVIGVHTREKSHVADHYIVAAGSYSAPLLRPLGLHLPVRPAKGYSVTFTSPGKANLKIPIVDDGMHAAVVPVGTSIRVAGTAEFAGFDLTLRPERVAGLVRLAQSLLPEAGIDVASAQPWCGLRPMSADGVPIIGRTPFSNLWINTGHGHLGWTLAAGSAELLAQLMGGEVPSLGPEAFAWR